MKEILTSSINGVSFNHHLRATKRVAVERGSDILEEILFLPVKGDSVTPFYKTLNEVHYDTAPFRQRDNRNSSLLLITVKS